MYIIKIDNIKIFCFVIFSIIITISNLFAEQTIYFQDFNEGRPTNNWQYYASNKYGRILIHDNKLLMDVSSDDHYCLNEAILTIDLSQFYNVRLNFFQSAFEDEENSTPEWYEDHYNGDGVSISTDAKTWYRIIDANELQMNLQSGQRYEIELDQVVKNIQSTHDPSFTYTSQFKIKFHQFDDSPYDSDGRLWDDITLSGNILNLSSHIIPELWYVSENIVIDNRDQTGIQFGFYYIVNNNPTTEITLENGIYTHDDITTISNDISSTHGLHFLHYSVAQKDLSPGLTAHIPFKTFMESLSITSTSHPNAAEVYSSQNVQINITGLQAGINYCYLVDDQPNTIPDASCYTNSTSNLILPGQPEGINYIHIRPMDSLRKLSPQHLTTHFRFNILKTNTQSFQMPVVKKLSVSPTIVSKDGKISIQATISLE